MKILIVEDDEEIRNLVRYFLEKEKYEVIDAEDGLIGLKRIREEHPEMVIFDVMIPGIDGISACSMIRKMPEKYGKPIIVLLTAKTTAEDLVLGFDSGADDYVKKPFDPKELIARVKNLMKRVNEGDNNIKTITYNGIIIDEEKHLVTYKNSEIELSKKEFDLLAYFIRNKGIVLTREKILLKLWGSDYIPGDRTVDVYIGKLRKKLPGIVENIKTLEGVGYKLD